MPEMLDYLKRTGYKVGFSILALRNKLILVIQAEELNALNVIHITGTKGKVSLNSRIGSAER